MGRTRVVLGTQAALGEAVSTVWKMPGQPSMRGAVVQFDLAPGTYVVGFVAVRDLTAHFYSRQRFVPNQQITISGLRVASNRTFDAAGVETTPPGTLNAFGSHVLGAGTISPEDRWTLELRLSDNFFLRSVTRNDVEQVALTELEDVFLALEYDTTVG